jgi:NADPH-dependent ferric siderophore reductase
MSSTRRRLAYVTEVQDKRRLSPSLVRVVVGGPSLRHFQPSPFTDSYVKLLFVPPDVPRPLPVTPDGLRVDVDEVKDSAAADLAPRMRSYTVRAFDAETCSLTLDFVVHGDEGTAGPWARDALPGDALLLLGPGGGYAPDPAAGRHLLAGDLSALPAVAVALERLGPDARGDAVLEVPGVADELVLSAPDGIRVRWVHQGDDLPGARLVEAVTSLAWPDDDVQAFVHGEAGAVRELRRYLRIERGMGLDRLSVSGYWRAGVDDEGWRAGKREWNAAIEDSERLERAAAG